MLSIGLESSPFNTIVIITVGFQLIATIHMEIIGAGVVGTLAWKHLEYRIQINR